MLVRGLPATLPEVVDLRKWRGPIKDQGAEGACTAHAGTSAREWIRRKYGKGDSPVFSPQYTYERELIAQGNFPNDVGSDGTTLCGTLITNGCCELAIDPYVAGQIVQPTADQDENAAQYTLGAFHGLQDSSTTLSVLGDPTPWPVLVGFTVYDSFESSTGKTFIYNPNTVNERALGGHEVLALGHDIGVTPTLRPAGCPPAVLIQNSWSDTWGDGGFFWMALPVLNDPETDLKIVHSGSPWT